MSSPDKKHVDPAAAEKPAAKAPKAEKPAKAAKAAAPAAAAAAPAAAAAAAKSSATKPEDQEGYLEQIIIDYLQTPDSNGAYNTLALSDRLQIDHQRIVGATKSLENEFYVKSAKNELTRWNFSAEAEAIIADGSPEIILWNLLAQKHAGGPLLRAVIDETLGAEAAGIAIGNGMKAKLFKIDKKPDGAVSYSVTGDASKPQVDTVQAALRKAKGGDTKLPAADVDTLKRRKLATLEVVKFFVVTKNAEQFRPKWNKAVAELTKDMLMDGSWATTTFKNFNLTKTDGKAPQGGHLHPLLKVRQEFREIFLELGFQEMEAQKWVESSFWNFDTLFVPQNHPARDSQDTFFVSKPEKSQDPPAEYFEATKNVHEAGYVGGWSPEESRRNVLRTHTTAVSSWVLYQLAQHAKKTGTDFTPGRFFSIDRVFRNEEMDKTHLCEFHQVEGFIVDRNLSLANMMHTLHQFFKRIGIEKLRFKPAYNPYTEPSMEIFGYHAGMDRWMEVGNSGVFRPEMLQPMGFPSDVTAIAWGLSLERPTMIKYGIRNIHELFGHNVNMKFIRRAPIARF